MMERVVEIDVRDRVAGVLARAGITPAFQPIADLKTGEIVGFEALARFEGGGSPAEWFSDAARVGLGVDLEVAAIRAALPHLQHVAGSNYLSVNVSPELAVSPRLLEVLDGAPLDRVVIEITEHTHVDDSDALLGALADLRARGVRLAIDDVGAGYSSMSLILHLHPDVIKLDVDLTRGIDQDGDRRALIASLVTFARAIGSRVVAEGIETEEEARTLTDLGVHSGQGYLLGKPGEVSLHALYANRQPSGRSAGSAVGLAAHVAALVEQAGSRATYEARRPRVRRWLALVAAVVMIFALSTTAAFAQSARPGDRLWWMKLRTEDLRLALEHDRTDRLELLVGFAQRRVTELELMSEERRALTPAVVARYERQLGAVRALARARPDPTLPAHVAKVIAGQRTELDALARDWCSTTPRSCRDVRRAARAASEIVPPDVGRAPDEPGSSDRAAGRHGQERRARGEDAREERGGRGGRNDVPRERGRSTERPRVLPEAVPGDVVP